MNKDQIVASMAEKAELTKKDAQAALEAFIDTVVESLESGEGTQLVGFGGWSVTPTSARKGRNPKTGEEIDIPAGNKASWKSGKRVREAVK